MTGYDPLEAFNAGEDAYMDGASVSANPYTLPKLRQSWFQGFDEMRKAMNDYEGAAR